MADTGDAYALVAEGKCTHQCLHARPATGVFVCLCVCRGAYHGLLGDQPSAPKPDPVRKPRKRRCSGQLPLWPDQDQE